jgi:hypothetical protein
MREWQTYAESMRQGASGLYVPDSYVEAQPVDIGPLGQSDYETQLDGLAFFASNPDIRCIWEFDESRGELPGLSLNSGVNIVPGTRYRIVCSFAPGRLIIHSPVALKAGRFNYALAHSVLFDSNVYNQVVRLVEDRDKLTAAERHEVQTLVEFIISRRYDYQLMPYVIESLAKKTTNTTDEYVLRGIRAILSLHVMDKEHFQATGEIRTSPLRVQAYEPEFGTTNLDEIARLQLSPYAETIVATPVEVTLNLIALQKMVLIRRCEMPQRQLSAQWAAFDEFFFYKVGIFSAQIRKLALLYFSGKLDGWIKVQRSSKPADAASLLLNSAWDLYLGSLPLHILAHSPESQPSICHFCTREAGLAELLSTSQIRMIRVSQTGAILQYLDIEKDLLLDAVGGEKKVLLSADARTRRFLADRDAGTVRRADHSAIEELATTTNRAFLDAIGGRS